MYRSGHNRNTHSRSRVSTASQVQQGRFQASAGEDLEQQNEVVGIDFGTTNSSVALVRRGQVEELYFTSGNENSRSSRSLLYLQREREKAGSSAIRSWTGAAAVKHYLEANEDEVQKRLIQSMKSHLAARSLTGTEIFGRQYRFEELVARILRELRRLSSEAFGFEVTKAVVGRPVMFVGADSEADNNFAEQRLLAALTDAGFKEVSFAMEPVAAAHAYQATHTTDGISLIGDFGGGTTDFSLLQVHHGQTRVLASEGVALAGDSFDVRIVQRLISPALGSNSSSLPLSRGLPALPAWIYRRLEHWHTLSFLRTREVRDMLRSAEGRASEPDKIYALRTIVEDDLGYLLHQAVQRVKVDLSQTTEAIFSLNTGTLHLQQDVSRAQFETWITPELERMRHGIDVLLAKAGIREREVDHVFLTGGTSLVPAVKQIFVERFGETEGNAGDVFTSVAQGLAWIAAKGAEGARVSAPSEVLS
jgi:hypothetical chaperone protein